MHDRPAAPPRSPSPDEIAAVMARVDAMLEDLESGLGSRPARTAAASGPTPAGRPGASASGGPRVAPRPRARTEPAPLPRPVPAHASVEPPMPSRRPRMVPEVHPEVRYVPTPTHAVATRLGTLAWPALAVALGLCAALAWWMAVRHVEETRVKPLEASELVGLVR